MEPEKVTGSGDAWAARFTELARWALERFFARTDRYGGYKWSAEEKAVVKRTFPLKGAADGAVNLALLEAHFRAQDYFHVVGPHALSRETNAGKWCAVDVDNHADVEGLPELNRSYAEARYAELAALGFRPLAADYGRGSVHLFVLFDRSVPGVTLKRFAEWMRDSGGAGPLKHEVFPKQEALSEQKKFGNWLRLVGRHHTRPVWAKVYDGANWLEGAAAVAHVLSLTGDSPDHMPEEVRFPKPKSAAQPPKLRVQFAGDTAIAVKRCRGYLQKVRPSIQKQGGSDSMFLAARIVWNDFGLDEADGYPILQEYNLKSDPVWPEEGTQGLRRKWDEAVRAGTDERGRGFKLNENRPGYTGPGARRQTKPPAKGVRTSTPPAEGDGTGESDPPADGEADAGPPEPERPCIVVNNRQYRDIEADALAALESANVPPTVFSGNGCGLVQLRRVAPHSPLAARELSADGLRSVLARIADWVSVEGEDKVTNKPPPPNLLKTFVTLGAWPGVPYLRSVVNYPVFAGPDFELHAATGYYPCSYLFLDLGALVIPEVPAKPSAEQVADARHLILTEMLGDFPFVDQASRANAVAALILPIVRHAIKGPTPLAVFDAPAAGTGKSLLAEVVFGVTLGRLPSAQSPDVGEEEWNKMLLAELVSGAPVIYFDNADQKLKSGALSSALTAETKRGRVLGSTKMVDAEINVCWVLTANNFECDSQVARRVVWSRIDRKIQDPAAARIAFRHPDLKRWVRENRPQLLAAIITLVNNWIAGGKKPGSARLGSFEQWAAVMSGILEAAGIDGLLDNAGMLRATASEQDEEMTAFVERWYERFAGNKVTAFDLFPIADGVLSKLKQVKSPKEEDLRRAKLGYVLRDNRGKVFGVYQIVAGTKIVAGKAEQDRDRNGRPRYFLQLTEGAQPTKLAEAGDAEQEAESEFELTA